MRQWEVAPFHFCFPLLVKEIISTGEEESDEGRGKHISGEV